MKPICICTALACLSIVPVGVAHAQSHGSQHASVDTKAVNAMCPIGKEPIVPSAGTVQYKDNTIGLCCPGCGKQFLAWDEERKDGFVSAAIASQSSPLKFGGVLQYGAMRDVMLEGATEPRVALAEFLGQTNIVAIGALAGLEGEIVILNGDVWVSRRTGPGVLTTRTAKEHATLLTVAEVQEWTSTAVNTNGLDISTFFRDEPAGGS